MGLGRGAQRVVRQGGAPPCRRGTGPMTTRTKKHEGNDEHEGDEEEQGEHDEQEGNEAAFAAGGGRTRIWCAGSSMTAAARDAERRIEARIAEQASSQNSPHRTHGWFFPRRRRLRIARCRPGHPSRDCQGNRDRARHPACGPHAGGSGENTSDRNIEPEGRPFRAPGSQARPRHRMTAPASTASTRRTGTRNAARFRMNAATLS